MPEPETQSNAPRCARLRDSAIELGASRVDEAVELARSIPIAWYRAQALALISNQLDTPRRAAALLQESADQAFQGEDAYRVIAVQAWPIAVAARRGLHELGAAMVARIMPEIGNIEPVVSRCSALRLLWDAAVPLGRNTYEPLVTMLAQGCFELVNAPYNRLRRRGKSELGYLIDMLWHIDRDLAEQILASTPDTHRAVHLRNRAIARESMPLFFDGQ
jgi:hypothetical protein